MLTRTADSLFWMSRNIERSEKIAGLLATELINVLETSDQEEYMKQELEMIVSISASSNDAVRLGDQRTLDMKHVTEFLLFNIENQNSIFNCVKIARENARSSRDHLSDDLWMTINEFHLFMRKERERSLSTIDIQQLLHRVKMMSLSAQGIIESTVSRGNDYRMIKIGKWIERADYTVRILLAICEKMKQSPSQVGYYMSLALQYVSGSNAYLKQNKPMMQPTAVIPFILNESSFPCSVMYCIEKLIRSIHQLQGENGTSYSYFLMQQVEDIVKGLDELEKMEEQLQSSIETFYMNYKKLQVS